MSDRLEALADRQEILDLSARYMRGQDRGIATLQQSVFHADATVDYGFFKGSAQDFVAFAQEKLAGYAATHHALGQASIWIREDRAEGEIYFTAYHRRAGDAGPEDLMIAGRYIDRYERRDGAWKILFRAEIVDWTHTAPAADDWFARTPSALRGGRRDRDPSAVLLWLAD